MPDVLTLEPEAAWRENRERMAMLLGSFFVLSAVEGLVVGLVAGAWWIGVPAGAALALLYLVIGARYGDGWMQTILRARPAVWPEASNMLAGLAQIVRVPVPELLEAPGDAPNALALGLRRRWLVLTSGARDLPRLELEALLAHELAHLRDGDGALASALVLITGAPELGTKGLRAPGGILALCGAPLWPVCLLIRAVRGLYLPASREHRADVCGAMVTRYPPGMRDLLRRAAVEHGTSTLRTTDPLWFAPRAEARGPGVPERTQLVSEM